MRKMYQKYYSQKLTLHFLLSFYVTITLSFLMLPYLLFHFAINSPFLIFFKTDTRRRNECHRDSELSESQDVWLCATAVHICI
jgi:hypothetical protein